MIKLKSKEKVLALYRNRYPALDEYAAYNLGKEYDYYFDLLKDLKTKDEVMEAFDKCIKRNEDKYAENQHIQATESNLHGKYMDILANYGLIVFFRDNILED